MRQNRLRERLKADEPSLGTRIQILEPTVVELIGHSGQFDYVEFVAEYAPYDLYVLEHLSRSVALFDAMTSMMKVEQELRAYLASRAIGAGIQNVLFSDVRTAADVQDCVHAVRAETPQTGGRHGTSLRRGAGFVHEFGTPAFVRAMEEVVIGLMIEKAEALEDLEALLSVKGVDMVQFGPGDYSMSIGHPGQFDHPDVMKAEQRVIETALKVGVAPRAEIYSPEQAGKYLEMGVRHFCIGLDVFLLRDWFTANGRAMREVLEKI